MANQPSMRKLSIFLWAAQILLALVFLMAGTNKIFQPIDQLAGMLPWVKEIPAGMVRFIGIAEICGALGLVLPSVLRIQPKLTVLAAYGLVLIMVLASAFHLYRGEAAVVPMNIVFATVAFFIAWGRTKKIPIYAR